MGSSSSPVVNVYPLANYTFGTKEPKMEKDTSVDDRLARMKVNYMKEGMRTSVEAILLVQEHNHPHVLLLQIGNTFYKLPGGRLKPGENEIEGLKRKLCSKLAVNSPSFPPNWQVGECVAVWWRPNFETVMYPYCPPHNTEPKECKKLFIVHLSEREYFAVPRNLKLLAVPLFELYNNVQQYEPVISAIPQQLSRFQFNMESALMELKKELQERSTQKLVDDLKKKVQILQVPDLSMAVSATRATPAKKRPRVDQAQKPREEITTQQEQLTGSEKDKIDDIDVERVKQLMLEYDLALAAARENPTEFLREAREARLRLTAAVLQPD